TKKTWVVNMDEIGWAWKGVMPDAFDQQHDTVRHFALWGSLMAGAAGAEWYFGYRYPHNDLMCEDFRSRELWWKQTRIAHDFFVNYIPFNEMQAQDNIVKDKDAYCLGTTGKVYAIYLPKGGNTQLDIPKGKYSLKWFNPRTGGALINGSVSTVNGGENISLGLPPIHDGKDWVALINVL
ncbi:MAG TPA: putative collagen-binding domain-containing protein, partial [Prolixibacteraceae bacterium]|nr:putative collagen-binding domain-containing protein [Prolixibacteraceae bacterium]